MVAGRQVPIGVVAGKYGVPATTFDWARVARQQLEVIDQRLVHRLTSARHAVR
ncbi:MAG TPA: hypothetical protein VMC83_38260 [Streptosporangiaceae bacterium]|nr:hypothetical protein [Streptosporangiaceae bacterium]